MKAERRPWQINLLKNVFQNPDKQNMVWNIYQFTTINLIN